MNARNTLLHRIKSGAVEETLDGISAISKHYQNSDYTAAAIFQNSRLQTLKDDRSRNQISRADYQLEFDKIRQATLELVSEIPENWEAQFLPSQKTAAGLPRILSPVIFIALGILFCLIGVYWYWHSKPAVPNSEETSFLNVDTAQSVPKDSIMSEENKKTIRQSNIKAVNPKQQMPQAVSYSPFLTGWVKDNDTKVGIPDVNIYVNSVKVKTGEGGFFKYELPNPETHDTGMAISVTFEKKGYAPCNELIYIPGSDGSTIFLSKIRNNQ